MAYLKHHMFRSIPSGLRLTGHLRVTIRGIFYYPMSQVAFLVDGFNLYHSVLRLMWDTGVCTKWLDIYSLCKSYLDQFPNPVTLKDGSKLHIPSTW